jgi:hypothetical protein
LVDQSGASVTTNTAVITKTSPPAVPPVAFFPTQLAEAGAEPYPAEWAGGKLILENGCLRLSLRSDLPSQLLIWPHGYQTRMNTGRVEVVCENCNATIVVGYSLDFTGWAVDARTVEKYIGKSLPTGCAGPYFIIHEIDSRFF